MGVLRDILKDKALMRYLIPAAVLISFNWGFYIWAINAGHVLDCSLGYYISPLMAFLLGVIVFREKYSNLQLAAVVLAAAGLLISVVTFGSFPYISLSLALSFAIYGLLKKKAHTDPVASIATETLVMSPFMLVVALFFLSDSIRALNVPDILLLAGGGIVTALPLILYASSINNISMVIVGFFQYISPSLLLVYGIFRGETLSVPQLISFVFIGLGLIVFSVALIRTAKMNKELEKI